MSSIIPLTIGPFLEKPRQLAACMLCDLIQLSEKATENSLLLFVNARLGNVRQQEENWSVPKTWGCWKDPSQPERWWWWMYLQHSFQGNVCEISAGLQQWNPPGSTRRSHQKRDYMLDLEANIARVGCIVGFWDEVLLLPLLWSCWGTSDRHGVSGSSQGTPSVALHRITAVPLSPPSDKPVIS